MAKGGRWTGAVGCQGGEMPGMWFGSMSYPAVIAAHPPDLLRIRPLESRMLGNLHVRFGGGRMEKGVFDAPRQPPTRPPAASRIEHPFRDRPYPLPQASRPHRRREPRPGLLVLEVADIVPPSLSAIDPCPLRPVREHPAPGGPASRAFQDLATSGSRPASPDHPESSRRRSTQRPDPPG